MQIATLFARGLFDHDPNSNHTLTTRVCPSEIIAGPQIVPFVGDFTYHQFATILSGACGIFSTVIVGVLIVLHATNYSNPVQQRQIIRVLLLVPWVSLFCFLIVWLTGAGEYLIESLDFGCAIALSAFLLFMCDLVLSHPTGFDALFGQGAQSRGFLNNGESPKALRVRIERSMHHCMHTNQD